MQDLTVTVIIPTFNRELLLKEAIESLFDQTLDSGLFELIVIDNCSADNTAQMIQELRRRAPFAITYRRMEKNGGCFRSWNIGVEMARTEFVAFLDSDARAGRHWLEKGVAGLETGRDVAFVSGHIADKPEQPVRFFSIRNGAPRAENPYYPAGNIFFRRSRFLGMGGFDETLSFGDVGTSPIGCADSDLCWRMKEAGLPYVYRRDVIVYHEVSHLTPLAWLKFHWRLISLPALVRRHPMLRRQLLWNLFFHRDNVFFYLFLLGVAAAPVSTWTLVLALPYAARAGVVPGRKLSAGQILKAPARLFMLGLRQTVICASLALGSLRARTLVL